MISTMTQLKTRVLWLLTALVAAGAGYQIVFAIEPGIGLLPATSRVAWSLVPVAYAVTATLIVSKQPRNPVGWVLLIPAVGSFLDLLTTVYFDSWATPPESIGPLALIAMAYSNLSWLLLIFPVFHLLLVFPTGRLVSNRWRWAPAIEIAMISILTIIVFITDRIGPWERGWVVVNAVGFGTLQTDLPNPIGFMPVAATEGGPFLLFWGVGLVMLTVAGVASMVTRYRRAGSVERHQVKWLLFASAIFGAVYIVASATTDFEDGGVQDVLLPLALIGIPVSVTIAVLRYRLFDIDRVVSRTVGYTIVVGVLGVIYAAGAIWLPSLVSGDSPIFIAMATLVAAGLFNPVRRGVLRAVDRRFYRAKYDAEKVVDSFKAQLRDQTDLDLLAQDWVTVVAETMQPATVGVWVKQR